MQIECPLCEAPYDGPVVFGGTQFVASCSQCHAEYAVGTEGVASADVVWEEPTVMHEPVFDDEDWLDETPVPRRNLPLAGVIRRGRAVPVRRAIPSVELEAVAAPPVERVIAPPTIQPAHRTARPTPAPPAVAPPRPPPRPPERPRVLAARPPLPPAPTVPTTPAPRSLKPWIVAGFLGGGAAVAAAVFLFVPRPALPPPAPAQAVVIARPAPVVVEAEPAEDAVAGNLALEIVGVEALPEQGAAVVFGSLANDTNVPQTQISLNVVLTVDGVPRRRRGVTCCDEFTVDEARKVARSPTHTHFRQQRPATTIDAGSAQDFAVVFPSVPADHLAAKLGAKLEVADAEPGDGS